VKGWALVLLLLAAGCAPTALGHGSQAAALPRIGPAPEFALTAQDGRRLALADLRGKVVAVTFIYTTCTDTCPLLTAKMAHIQRALGPEFGPAIQFVSITVDPERDTPEVLAAYAAGYGADPAGWAFLTGTPLEILDVSRRYGVYARKTPRGDVDHTFLTSLVDRAGTLRVQYLGTRFDPEELRRDLLALAREEPPR
jgi:protein SCO1/2